MIAITIWCVIFLVYALGISIFIIGIMLQKIGLENIFFMNEYVVGFLFNLEAFVLEILGVVIFYCGYSLMEWVK